MAGTHEAHHPHPNYWAVFAILVVATAVSFWTVSRFWPGTPAQGHTLVMVVAVIKATLVAMYFMHLKYDWFKVYMMVIPALLLGAVLLCGLLPDIAFSHDLKIRWLLAEVGD